MTTAAAAVLSLLVAERAACYAALVEVGRGSQPSGVASGWPAGQSIEILDAVRALPSAGYRLPLPAELPQLQAACVSWSLPQAYSTRWLLLTGFRVAELRLYPLAHEARHLLIVAADPQGLPSPHALQQAVVALNALLAAGIPSARDQASHLRAEAVVAHLGMPVVLIEADPMRAWVNPPARAWLGLPAGPLSLREVSQALRGRLQGAGIQAADPLHEVGTGEVYRAELHHDGKDWELVSTSIREQAQVGRLWVFTDITLVRQLARQAGELQRVEALSRLVGGVAHQFNNLLTVVIGNADLLLDQHPADSAAGASLDGILAAADRGADIVRQLLVIGRATGGSGSEIVLHQELQALVPVIRATCEPQVHWHYAPDPAHAELKVRVDLPLFREAVLQIVANACDAMPAGGALSLTLEVPVAVPASSAPALGAREARPVPPAAAPQRQVILRFTDSGCGMSPETLARAFEPFFTTREMAVARGLGLSVVEGFALQSGGQVCLQSVPGSGTCVRLALPVLE